MKKSEEETSVNLIVPKMSINLKVLCKIYGLVKL